MCVNRAWVLSSLSLSSASTTLGCVTGLLGGGGEGDCGSGSGRSMSVVVGAALLEEFACFLAVEVRFSEFAFLSLLWWRPFRRLEPVPSSRCSTLLDAGGDVADVMLASPIAVVVGSDEALLSS